MDHLLVQCAMAQDIWNLLLSSFGYSWVLPLSIHNLFEAWMFGSGSSKRKLLWRASFFVTVWAIRKERNQRSFEGKSFSTPAVFNRLKFHVALWVSVLPEFWGMSIVVILCNWRDVTS